MRKRKHLEQEEEIESLSSDPRDEAELIGWLGKRAESKGFRDRFLELTTYSLEMHFAGDNKARPNVPFIHSIATSNSVWNLQKEGLVTRRAIRTLQKEYAYALAKHEQFRIDSRPLQDSILKWCTGRTFTVIFDVADPDDEHVHDKTHCERLTVVPLDSGEYEYQWWTAEFKLTDKEDYQDIRMCVAIVLDDFGVPKFDEDNPVLWCIGPESLFKITRIDFDPCEHYLRVALLPLVRQSLTVVLIPELLTIVLGFFFVSANH